MEYWSSFSTASSPSPSAVPPPPSPFTSNIPPQDKHDVFLSFRGEDTRNTFASHLHAALSRQQIRTYIDYNLQRGNEISPTLVRAIEEAKVSVIIFSKNYASSKWCLDELAKIIECKLKNGQIVVPVFYHIDPSDVLNQRGSYADAFAEHERQYKDSLNKVQRWRVALAAAAKLSGWECSPNRLESEVVEKIAEDVLQKLDAMHRGGLDSKIATYKQMAEAKLEKSLRTGNLQDIEDLTTTLQELADLKLEKALRTDQVNDWEELNITYQRILQLKQDKFIHNYNQRNWQDFIETQQRISQIQTEQKNRMSGLYRGV